MVFFFFLFFLGHNENTLLLDISQLAPPSKQPPPRILNLNRRVFSNPKFLLLCVFSLLFHSKILCSFVLAYYFLSGSYTNVFLKENLLVLCLRMSHYLYHICHTKCQSENHKMLRTSCHARFRRWKCC